MALESSENVNVRNLDKNYQTLIDLAAIVKREESYSSNGLEDIKKLTGDEFQTICNFVASEAKKVLEEYSKIKVSKFHDAAPNLLANYELSQGGISEKKRDEFVKNIRELSDEVLKYGNHSNIKFEEWKSGIDDFLDLYIITNTGNFLIEQVDSNSKSFFKKNKDKFQRISFTTLELEGIEQYLKSELNELTNKK